MEYLKFSIEDLEKISLDFAKNIKVSYQPDAVIFVAKGGYIIGKMFSEYFGCPLLYVKASRSGGQFKNILKKFFPFIPEKIRILLRKRELSSNLHEDKSERNIFFDKNQIKENQLKRILVVDDSVDTGYTAKSIMVLLNKIFSEADLRFAALNVFEKSCSVFKIDFFYYKETILNLPSSNDSKYNKEFERMYSEYMKYEIKGKIL